MIKKVNIHTHQYTINEENNIEVVSLFHNESLPEDGLFSIGIHPWHAEKNTLQPLLDEMFPKIRFAFAIGECGLDKSSTVDWKRQMKVFRKQIELSEDHKKPLIIHAVRCYSDIIAIHKAYKPKQKWIIHSFQGNKQEAEQLIKHGIYLSFGTNLLRENDKLIESLKATPLDYLFFETDEDSIEISKIYKYAASVLNISEEELTARIYSNFTSLQN